MGNSTTKSHEFPNSVSDNHVNQGIRQQSQSGVSSVGNLSERSITSYNSCYSVYSASRPWSRVSRRRWNNSTLTDPWLASKTAWPVANIESYFLPEFKIDCNNNNRKFRYIDTIAKGAFGKVYKVCHSETNKLYALKILSKSQVVSDNCIQQIKEEVHIQEVCGHNQFIVELYLKWQSRKRLYIVTEFIPGGELLNLIHKYAKLPEELVQIYVAQIGLVVDFLHNAGIIYRDLKPENLLLDTNGNLKLIDFGLSKWLKFGSKTRTLCGTLDYMAPEVCSHEPYGHAVDWWSLGILMWKMMTNEFPKFTTTLSEKVSEQEMSDEAKKLIMRLLEKNPVYRLRTLKALQETAFFKGFNFELVKNQKINGNDILNKYYPSDESLAQREEKQDTELKQQEVFVNFDHLNL